MSKYTTEVRFICQSLANDIDVNDVENIIANSIDKIFDFNFPIFDEQYRKILETKILKHYYTREIGEETVGLWKLRLNTRLNEIMPYYNKLYESELLEFNPLYTKNVIKNGNNKGKGNSTDTNTHNDISTRTDDTTSISNTSNNAKNLYSDTPQGTINNIDVVQNAYLTNATIVNNNGNETLKNTGTVKNDNNGSYTLDKVFTDTNEYAETIMGYDGYSPSRLVSEFREILLNIDLMIIDELADLFMNLW